MNKVIVWIGATFAPIGLILAAIGGWFFLTDRNLVAGGVHAEGTVTEMVSSRDTEGRYSSRPVVEFNDADGTRHVFTSSVATSPPSHSPGERVDVIYPREAPDAAIIDSFWDRFSLPLMFGGMGAIFTATGLGLLIAWLRRRRIVAWLRTNGIPIQAKVTECYLDTSVRVNGRSPFRVVCQATHPATGQPHSFKSDALWTDPSGWRNGSEVRVFVDPARPKRYAVDLPA